MSGLASGLDLVPQMAFDLVHLAIFDTVHLAFEFVGQHLMHFACFAALCNAVEKR